MTEIIGELSTSEYDRLVSLIAQAYAEADRLLGRKEEPADEYRRQAAHFLAAQRAVFSDLRAQRSPSAVSEGVNPKE